jgi:hypothetical protein
VIRVIDVIHSGAVVRPGLTECVHSGSLLLIPIERAWHDFREVKHFRGLDSLVHDCTLSCVTCFDGLSSSPEISALKASSRVMMRGVFPSCGG